MIFGSEQLISSKVKESNRPMGGTTNVGYKFDPRGTHNQNAPKWPSRVLFSS